MERVHRPLTFHDWNAVSGSMLDSDQHQHAEEILGVCTKTSNYWVQLVSSYIGGMVLPSLWERAETSLNPVPHWFTELSDGPVAKVTAN